MTYKEIVTLVKTIAETINPDGSFFHGRTYETTLEFGSVYPQIHLYPFTMQPEQSNYNIIRSELLVAFWKQDGHENTMEQREDMIAEMDDLCVLFEAAIRATENVQVLSFRKEPQYLSQMGVVSGIACNISLHSAVLCVAPTDQAPVNLTLPLITGLNILGATLSGSNGTWSGNPDTFTYTYQWKRNGVNISGATNNTYLTTVLDSEADITFEVTASNGVSPNGVATSLAVTMADYTPVNILAPEISGSTSLGSTLTTTNGSWSNSPSIFSYQWKRNGINISGASNSTYVTVVADSTASITCEVTASNGLTSSPASSNTLVMANYTPVNTVAPVVTGNAIVGQTLSTTNGTWTNSPSIFSYQWYRGASPIGGATNSTYVLVSADMGQNIKCNVTASNGLSANADSNTLAILETILDATANAASAWDINVLLRGAYFGSSLLRVRRSGDNAEFDFGVGSDGLTNWSSVTAFCVAGGGTQNGFVVTVYDQTGNARHATQTTAANQVQIVSGGVLLTETGTGSGSVARGGFRFDGTNDVFEVPTSQATYKFIHDGGLATIVGVHRFGNTANPDAVYSACGNSASDGNNIGFVINYDDRSSLSRNNRIVQGVQRANAANPTVANVSADNAITPNQLNLFIAVIDADNATAANRSTVYVNNGAAIQNNVLTNAPNVANATFNLQWGGAGNNAALMVGAACSLIIWNSDQTANLTTIKNNRNGFYKTY